MEAESPHQIYDDCPCPCWETDRESMFQGYKEGEVIQLNYQGFQETVGVISPGASPLPTSKFFAQLFTGEGKKAVAFRKPSAFSY